MIILKELHKPPKLPDSELMPMDVPPTDYNDTEERNSARNLIMHHANAIRNKPIERDYAIDVRNGKLSGRGYKGTEDHVSPNRKVARDSIFMTVVHNHPSTKGRITSFSPQDLDTCLSLMYASFMVVSPSGFYFKLKRKPMSVIEALNASKENACYTSPAQKFIKRYKDYMPTMRINARRTAYRTVPLPKEYATYEDLELELWFELLNEFVEENITQFGYTAEKGQL